MCVLPRLRRPLLPLAPADFNVYYAAAMLVRTGQGDRIYAGADTGADPQKLVASADNPLFQVARSQGVRFVGLYVYPPILADMLAPLTYARLRTATRLWLAINLALLVATALLVGQGCHLRLRSPGTALLVVAALCFVPNLQCLVDGQITILLLFLWTAGVVLLQRDREMVAAALFALAAVVKLTPLLVLLPFLLWRRWRFLSSFLTAGAGLVLLCLAVNTPATCLRYMTRVIPAMSGAIPSYSNYALPAATQRLLLALLHGGQVAPVAAPPPAWIVHAGQAASATFVSLFLWFMARRTGGREDASRSCSTTTQGRAEARARVIALLGLLAPALSPVSWFHAYATAFVAFSLLWHDALRRNPGLPYLLLLSAVSLSLGSAAWENASARLVVSNPHAGIAALLQFLVLLAAGCLVLCSIQDCGSTALESRSLH